MSHQVDAPMLVLHALRLKGVAEAPAVAVSTGLDGDEVEVVLADLAADGLVERRQGALPGWAPTATGRGHDGILVAAELDATASRSRVEAAYRAFLALNPELLAACAAWQLRPDGADGADRDGDGGGGGRDGPPVVNDHTDPVYDAGVVSRLAAVHEQVQPVLDALAGALARFAPYRTRLSRALTRVKAGEGDWFTWPLCDSYHSVWFELHEDLLATLGLDRGQEPWPAR